MKFRLIFFALPLALVFTVAGGVMMILARPTFGTSDYFVPTRYPVTPEMLRAAASLERTPSPNFRLSDQDGALIADESLRTGKPSLLLFIANGCPCTIEAQPVFNNLAAAYGGDVQFFGVINDDAGEARAFQHSSAVPFPLIVDPTKSLARAFKLKASASFALLDGEGHVVKIFPGYSQDVLRQANFLLGGLTQSGAREFDDTDAPTTLTAGCAFFPVEEKL